MSNYFNLAGELQQIVPQEFKEGIQEILQNQNITTNAEMILALCRKVTSKIDIYITHQYFYGKPIDLYKRKTLISEKEENDLMVYATQLIYLLRQFLTDEEIMFHMATKDREGKYKADAFIPQREILKKLSVVKKNAVGVSLILQSELISNFNQNFLNEKRKNLWKRVEYLSEARYISGRSINKIDMRKKGAKKAHWAYQSQKKDNLIYLKFSGTTITKYYDLNESGTRESLQDFNNGWLWEWYNEILYSGSDEQYQMVTNSIKAGSIKPIIMTPDYIPGTKQGDWELQGQQIQSKYSNNKIISFNNIRHILYKLDLVLSDYIKEGQNENVQQRLLSVLQEHFFPDSVDIGNKYANDKAEDIFKKFNAKKVNINLTI